MNNIQEILKKELTRTEFLGLIGAGIVSIIGVSSILKALGMNLDKQTSKAKALDYGDSLYGGDKNKGNL